MEVGINITKKGISVFLLVLVALTSVIATGWSHDDPYHTTLYSDILRSKTGNTVTVDDTLSIAGTLHLNGLRSREIDQAVTVQGDVAVADNIVATNNLNGSTAFAWAEDDWANCEQYNEFISGLYVHDGGSDEYTLYLVCTEL